MLEGNKGGIIISLTKFIRDVQKIHEAIPTPGAMLYNATAANSRVSDPKIAFSIIDKVTFCKKWLAVKKLIDKDRWLKDRVIFWQKIFEQVH